MTDFADAIKTFFDNNCPNYDQFVQLLTEHNVDLGRVVVEDCSFLLSVLFGQTLDNENFDRTNRLLLDFCWEKLHCGHWQNVKDCWRILYALLQLADVIFQIGIVSSKPACNYSIPTSLFAQLPKLISKLDLSLIMGMPIFDQFASKLAHLLHNFLTTHIPDKDYLSRLRMLEQLSTNGGDSSFNCEQHFDFLKTLNLKLLDRIERPALETFSKLMHTGKPFIVTESINFWPACCRSSPSRNWTLYYWFKHFAYRLVPIEIGSKYTDSNWGQELMTIGQFICQFVIDSGSDGRAGGSSRPKGYLAQHQLFLQIPELERDLYVPDYCLSNAKMDTDNQIDINVWFGPANTISPLHHDGDRANLLSQIRGFKLVILYPSCESANVYAHDEQMLRNTSQLDVEHPDVGRFPQLVQAKGFYGILGPGEMLYIPPKCWHYVRSLTISYSVNFWWNVVSDLVPSFTIL